MSDPLIERHGVCVYSAVVRRLTQGVVHTVCANHDPGSMRRKQLFGSFMGSGFIPRNHFMRSSMLAMGGGEIGALASCEKKCRRGGTITDAAKYLLKFQSTLLKSEHKWALSIEKLCSVLGLKQKALAPRDPSRWILDSPINWKANSGPSWSAQFPGGKAGAWPFIWQTALRLVEDLKAGQRYPPCRYGLAGRAKLKDWRQHEEAAISGSAYGRAVLMADAHEPLVSGCFARPLYDELLRLKRVIMVGFNRFDHAEVKTFAEELSTFSLFIELDISGMDRSINIALLRRVFELVDSAFVLKQGWKNVLNWVQGCLTSHFVQRPDGGLWFKQGGIPSGSGFTIILDSLLMAIASLECLKALSLNHYYRLKIQGDNVLIALRVPGGRRARREVGEGIVNRLSREFDTRFGMKLNVDKSRVSTDVYAGIATPIALFPEMVSVMGDCSRRQIRAMREHYMEMYGKFPSRNEEMEYLEGEPKGGLVGRWTHRWHYVFAGRVSWLSYYFRKEGGMIRPTAEVLDRLVNPEKPPRNIDEHICLLRSALIDNYENQHVRNRIMHLMYDAGWMSMTGVTSLRQAKADSQKMWASKDGETCLPALPSPQNVRAWYRRSAEWVDLDNHPYMKAFMMEWNEELRRAERTRRDWFTTHISEYYVHRRSFREWSRYDFSLTQLLEVKTGIADAGLICKLIVGCKQSGFEDYLRAQQQLRDDPKLFDQVYERVVRWDKFTYPSTVDVTGFNWADRLGDRQLSIVRGS